MKKSLVVVVWALVTFLGACKISTPGKIETRAAQTAKKVTVGGKDWKNPVPNTNEALETGAAYFRQYCQACHGADGHRTGVLFADTMSPPVPDLASEDVQDYTDGQLKWVIQNGIRFTGMPGWEGILKDEEMWYMVRYIRNLPVPLDASEAMRK